MSKPHRLFRLVLLAAALCAANLAVADLPASAPFTTAQQQAIRQISASEAQAQVPLVASAAAASVAKTIEGEKQAIDVAKDALEVGRKSVDWWLTALGLVMALAGIGLSVWLSRKHDEVEVKLKEADAAKQKAEIALRHAEQLIENFSKQASLIPNADAISDKLSADVIEKLKVVKPPQVVRLIEQAWAAHHQKNWVIAKPLWALLSLIESQDANVWFNLAYAEHHSGEDWQLISDGYHRAHLLEPSAVACCNLGTALFAWAKTLSAEARQQRFAEADQRFAEATRLRPDYAVAYYNWGNALVDWAKILTGEAKQQRFAEADQRFAEATRLKPDFAEAYSNWGNALLDWAQTLTGEAQQQRFAEADQRYAEATRLKPDFVEAYSNWGIALLNWVHTLPSDERAAKLDEAERVLLLGKEKGSKNLYDLACLRAMQQRPDEARTLLEETRAAGLLPDFAHLSTDRDLDNLRGLEWFQALLEEVKQQEAGKQGST